jgi:hypothetical protein
MEWVQERAGQAGPAVPARITIVALRRNIEAGATKLS